ncbi:MAG TPA: amino acid ABC transporter permease [Bradyrhizobium sp.]|uniref:amino acid ABC transporter permease n=1 Tax=Bradyrhizobium sp. TaxID=376 RepID=UPI002D80CC02|nr:amino acid ABC transporter permease [Bradyrhizobium sp.]HET7889563.1 amino acid ABC transporter permease [Bradyrhizobium sp.]
MIDWSVLWQGPNGRTLLDALLLTFQIAAVSWVLSMLLGIGIGLLREGPVIALRFVGTVYVEIFRNIPLLVQLFFVYFIFPRILPAFAKQVLFNYGWEIAAAIITLSLYSSAKIAELVKSGFNTIGPGLRMAAASSGLTWWQAQRHIFLNLLLRTITPGLASEFVTIFKGSSLAMAVGVAETTYVTRQLGTETFQWLPVNVYASAVYLLCAWAIAAVMLLVEKRIAIPGRIGG